MFAVFKTLSKVYIHQLLYYVYAIEYCDRNNTTVQERLFDRMDDLLQLDVAIPEMADLLSEVRCYLMITYYCSLNIEINNIV